MIHKALNTSPVVDCYCMEAVPKVSVYVIGEGPGVSDDFGPFVANLPVPASFPSRVQVRFRLQGFGFGALGFRALGLRLLAYMDMRLEGAFPMLNP